MPYRQRSKMPSQKKRPSFDDVKRQLKDDRKAKGIRLNENDVICGRGNGIAQQQGNINFRRIVWEFRDTYEKAYRNAKKEVAVEVIEDIASLDPPGRFVCRLDNDTFVEVPYERALEKTCQALREKKLQPPPASDDEEDEKPSSRRSVKNKSTKKAPVSSKRKSNSKKPPKPSKKKPSETKGQAKPKKSKKRSLEGTTDTSTAAPAKKRKTTPARSSKQVIATKKAKKQQPKKSQKASRKKKVLPKINDTEEKATPKPIRVKTPQAITPKFRYFNSKSVPLTDSEEVVKEQSPETSTRYVAPETPTITFDESDFNDLGFKAQIDIQRPQRTFAVSPKFASTPAAMTPNASSPPPPRQTIMEDICLPEAMATSDKPPLLPISGEVDNMISLLPPHLTAFVSGIFSDLNHAAMQVEESDTGSRSVAGKRLDQMSSPKTVLPGDHTQAPRLEFKHSLFLEGDDSNEDSEDKNLAVAATLQEWGISGLGANHHSNDQDWWSLG